MISRSDLRLALRELSNADWTIAETSRRSRTLRGTQNNSAIVEDHRSLQHFTTTLHRDFPVGRGSAQSSFSADSFTSQGVVAALAQACTAQIQTPWRMAPPSAAAQARLDDAALRDPTAMANMVRALQSAAAAATFDQVEWELTIGDDTKVVETSTGNEIRWTTTDYQLGITAQRAGHWLETRRCGRQRNDIDATQLCLDLDQELPRLATAAPTPRGPIELVLDREAMLFDGDLGVWCIVAEQAHLQRLTSGVSRLPKTVANSTLRIVSDGARNFGWRSAPVADDGAPVRRFVLIANGAVVSRGSNVTDAGRGNNNGLANANGGVRNLDVSDQGPAWQPPATYLEVHRFEAPRMDLATGWLTALIASATLHRGETQTPVTGGAIRVDLVSRLLAGRPRGTALTTASYQGPRQIVLGLASVY